MNKCIRIIKLYFALAPKGCSKIFPNSLRGGSRYIEVYCIRIYATSNTVYIIICI